MPDSNLTADSPKTSRVPQSLRVTRFDRLNAWLLAWIVCLSGILFLLVMFATTAQHPRPLWSSNIGPVVDRGEDEKAFEVIEPSEDEFPEAQAPERLVKSISNVAWVVGELRQRGDDGVLALGLKERREPSPLPPIVQQFNPARWKLTYQVDDFEAYIDQLAHLKMELGVLEPATNRIYRLPVALPLSDLPNRIEISSRNAENERSQIHFVQTKQRLKRWDREIVNLAGLSDPDLIIVHLPEPTVVATMRALERAEFQADGKTAAQVGQTWFKIEVPPDGSDSYRITIQRIDYRDVKK